MDRTKKPERVESLLPSSKGKSAEQSPTVILILDRMSSAAPAGGDRGPAPKKEKSDVDYMPAESGPFECSTCGHFSDGLCDQPDVMTLPKLEKAKDGRAVVEEKSWCRRWEAKKG